MRHWERARVVEACGHCAAAIAVDAPVQVIKLPDVKKRRVRCERCANAPVDLDQLKAWDAGERAYTRADDGGDSRFEFTGATRNLFDATDLATGGQE
jgi:hypothetical protein